MLNPQGRLHGIFTACSWPPGQEPSPKLASPLHVVTRKAFHSGIWRTPFVMASLGKTTWFLGKVAPKRAAWRGVRALWRDCWIGSLLNVTIDHYYHHHHHHHHNHHKSGSTADLTVVSEAWQSQLSQSDSDGHETPATYRHGVVAAMATHQISIWESGPGQGVGRQPGWLEQNAQDSWQKNRAQCGRTWQNQMNN